MAKIFLKEEKKKDLPTAIQLDKKTDHGPEIEFVSINNKCSKDGLQPLAFSLFGLAER